MSRAASLVLLLIAGKQHQVYAAATQYGPIATLPGVPLRQTGGEPCTVAVLSGAFKSYNDRVQAKYTPPACLPKVPQVVLTLHGSVRGVQYDRFGALWMRSVELLRFTTPEPTSQGIHWQVAKDVSDYAKLFQKEGVLVVQLPNIVNVNYTGIFYVNVTVDLRPAGDKIYYHEVTPLRSAMPSLFAMESRGPLAQSYNVHFKHQDIIEARLDVLASGHGCEEFWYLQPPQGVWPDADGCGDGPYREVLVWVDGKLAGAHFPFPVIYSGGINPLLWHSLAGIDSFDVPAIHIDLSPFLGELNDGHAHNISLQVFGNSPAGFWLLSGALLLRRQFSAALWGVLTHSEGSWTAMDRNSSRWHNCSNSSEGKGSNQSSTPICITGERHFKVLGTLVAANGVEIARHQVSGELIAQWHMEELSSTRQVTSGDLRQVHQSKTWRTSSLSESTRVERYPFKVDDFGQKHDDHFVSTSSVTYAKDIGLTLSIRNVSGLQDKMEVTMRESYLGHAHYKRSLQTETVSRSSSHASATYEVSDGLQSSKCAELQRRTLGNHSSRISVNSSRESPSCKWRRGIYPCGADFCGHWSFLEDGKQIDDSLWSHAGEIPEVPKEFQPRSEVASDLAHHISSMPPGRSPRAWLAKVALCTATENSTQKDLAPHWPRAK